MKAIEIVAQKKFYSSLTNQPFEIVHTFFIDEYKAKNKEAVKGMKPCINSEPFYTKTGYHMCLRVYLDGDQTGKSRRYMSIFCVVMRGRNDDKIALVKDR